MKKHPFFYDVRHAKMYLQHSVIRFKKQPIYIINVTKGSKEILIHFIFLLNTQEQIINITNKDLNFLPVPLGYANKINKDVHIYIRKPVRAWKIGLSLSNIRVTTYSLTPLYIPNNILFSNSLYKTIINNYPTYSETRKKLKKSDCDEIIAFHRHFCLRKEKDLIKIYYYKYKDSIGFPALTPILNPKFSFLNEHLKDAINEK